MAQLPNKQAAATQPKPAALPPVPGTEKKKRNKRADITDLFRPPATDAAATANFDKVMSSCDKAWQHIVETLRKSGVKVGTRFESKEFGTHEADVLAYPFPIVLQLAQSRQHNKLMDSYSDSEMVKDPIGAAREVDAELVKGTWSQRGEGGPRFTLLDRAIAALYGVSIEEASQKVAEIEEENGEQAVKDLRKDAAIKAKMDAIKLEDAQRRAAESAQKTKGMSLPSLFANKAAQ